MAEKSTKLSIVIATVDAATAKIKAINERLDKLTKPTRDFKKALGDLAQKSGLSDIANGIKGVGSELSDLVGKVASATGVMAGFAVAAVAGVVHLIDKFDDLGKVAQRIGIGADDLAQLRFAAEKSGAPIEMLDRGMEDFSKNLGYAQAGQGRLYKFLQAVNPALAKQLLHTKNAREAILDYADALSKESDPARRAALAGRAGIDPALIPFLQKGSRGIEALTKRYAELAPGQGKAADAAAEAKSAMIDLHASLDGVEAAIVTGLGPAFKDIAQRITKFVTDHQADIAAWAQNIGDKLPAAFDAVVSAVKGAINWLEPFVDSAWKIKAALVAVAAIMVGPLISAFATLGVAVLSSPIGLEIAAWTAAAVAAVAAITAAVKAGHWLGRKAAFHDLKNHYALQVRDGNPDLSDDEVDAQAEKLAAYDMAAQDAKEAADDKRAQAAIDAAGAPPPSDVFDQSKSILSTTNVSAQARSAIAPFSPVALPPAQDQKAHIIVDVKNAQPGTRVTTAPGSTADVDLSVGYALGFGV